MNQFGVSRHAGACRRSPALDRCSREIYQGDADTLKEVRDRAKRDAETRAIENAVGTFIKSHTLVSNHQIAEDLVYAAVRGKITKRRSYRPDGTQRTETCTG